MNNSFFRYPYSDSIDEIPKYDDKITIITNLYGYSYCGNIPSKDISERVYYCSYSLPYHYYPILIRKNMTYEQIKNEVLSYVNKDIIIPYRNYNDNITMSSDVIHISLMDIFNIIKSGTINVEYPHRIKGLYDYNNEFLRNDCSDWSFQDVKIVYHKDENKLDEKYQYYDISNIKFDKVIIK